MAVAAQGFGRVQLDNALWFSDTTAFSLLVQDNLTLAGDKDRDTVVSITASGTLKVTLVWSDPPAQTTSGLAAVNNLDLIVGRCALRLRGAGRGGAGMSVGVTWCGLASTTGDALAGNFKTKRDERNNAEHVLFDVRAGDSVKVKVRGFNVPVGNGQPYALVIKGPFNRATVDVRPLCDLGSSSCALSISRAWPLRVLARLSLKNGPCGEKQAISSRQPTTRTTSPTVLWCVCTRVSGACCTRRVRARAGRRLRWRRSGPHHSARHRLLHLQEVLRQEARGRNWHRGRRSCPAQHRRHAAAAVSQDGTPCARARAKATGRTCACGLLHQPALCAPSQYKQGQQRALEPGVLGVECVAPPRTQRAEVQFGAFQPREPAPAPMSVALASQISTGTRLHVIPFKPTLERSRAQ